MIAHFNVNWLSPVKVRTTLLGGEKKMVVWNDLEADEKVRVYDKGVDITTGQGVYDLLVSYRSGDESGLALYGADGGNWKGIWTYAGGTRIGAGVPRGVSRTVTCGSTKRFEITAPMSALPSALCALNAL